MTALLLTSSDDTLIAGLPFFGRVVRRAVADVAQGNQVRRAVVRLVVVDVVNMERPRFGLRASAFLASMVVALADSCSQRGAKGLGIADVEARPSHTAELAGTCGAVHTVVSALNQTDGLGDGFTAFARTGHRDRVVVAVVLASVLSCTGHVLPLACQVTERHRELLDLPGLPHDLCTAFGTGVLRRQHRLHSAPMPVNELPWAAPFVKGRKLFTTTATTQGGSYLYAGSMSTNEMTTMPTLVNRDKLLAAAAFA